MAVLAILAVLAAVALPIYRGYALRAERTSAQAELLRCAQGMERHAGRTGSYAGAADADGDGAADADTGPVSAIVCAVDADAYRVTVAAADARRFVLQATPAAGGVAAGGRDAGLGQRRRSALGPQRRRRLRRRGRELVALVVGQPDCNDGWAGGTVPIWTITPMRLW